MQRERSTAVFPIRPNRHRFVIVAGSSGAERRGGGLPWVRARCSLPRLDPPAHRAPACATAGWPSGALAASVLGVGLEAVGPLLTRVAVDDAVAGSTAVLGSVVVARARAGAGALRHRVPAPLPRPAGSPSTCSTTCAGRCSPRCSGSTGERQDALRTGQVVSRAITDLQLVQSLLSMVPLALGARRARRRRRSRRCCGSRRCSPWSRWSCCRRRAGSRCARGRRCSRPPGRPSSGPPTSPSTSRRRSPASGWSRASARRPARSPRWSGARRGCSPSGCAPPG